jgi:hypothetical protein
MRRIAPLLLVLAGLVGCLDEAATDASNGGLDPALPGETNTLSIRGFYVGPDYALFLSPQGEAVFTTNWKGLIEEFDFAAAIAAAPKNAGTWRTSGGKLFIDFRSGTTWVARLVSADEFQLESGRTGAIGTFIRRPKSVAPTVTGRFKRGKFSYFGVDSSGTASGATSSDHWITFGSDGTVVVYDETGVYLGGEYLSDIKRLVGDYSIDGLMLTISEASGKVTKHDLWVKEGSAESPRLIVYDSSVYLGE